MASYNELLALIDAYINQNGVQAITGQVLNGVLRAMVDQLGRGYTIMGTAVPSTDPGTPDGPESWFASTPGTYTDMGGLTVANAELALLSYTPSDGWAKTTLTQGIVSTSASVDDTVGTPSVTSSYVNGVLTFEFHNLKGNTGDPAGFGAITASVDDQIGTPSVQVQTSGPDTAKAMSFQFHNLKGETGVTSVVATVDNTTGNPTCSVSLVGQELHLDFTGLKGVQGNTGVSADYPITIANNLTTNDPTAALSAAMGVQLESEVSQLEAEVDDLEGETSVMFTVTPNVSSIDWQQTVANSQLVSIGTTLKKGILYKMGIKFTGFSSDNLAKLSSIYFYLQSGTQVGGNFQTSDYFGYRSDFADEDWHYIFYVPTEDIKFVRVIFSSSYAADTPAGSVYFKADEYAENYVKKSELTTEVQRIDGEISGIQNDITELNEEIDGVPESVYDLSSYTQNRGTANNDGTWSSYGSNNYKHIAIPVTVGDKLEIVAGSTYRARYGFLSEYSAPNANNTTVHFAPGCVCETIDVDTAADMVVPEGAAYMYVETLQGGTDCTPASITDLGKKSKVESLQYAVTVDFDAYDSTIISSAFAYKSGWYIVHATGKWNSGGDYGGISIPVFDAQKMMVKGSSYALAFLKSNQRVIGTIAPFCRGFNAVIIGTEDKMFDIPSDCKFVYFLRLDNGANALPDSCVLYFEKTEAIQKRRPIVSFVDDDARKAQLEWLEPIVKETSVPITIALITTAVGETNYCTWDELRRFRNIGFRFVAHGATNITTMDVDEIEASFISTQSAMESHAMLDSDMFVLPNGGIDSTTRPVVEDYFKCAYSTSQRVNVVPLADKYTIRRISIDSGAASLPYWKEWVDYAINTRGWVIFYGHSDGANYDEAMRTAYIELIDYCKSNGVTILSLPDAWKECSLLTAND